MDKRYINIIIAFTLFMGFTASCGDEADPELDYHDPTNFFIPDVSAKDSTSMMRRNFFEEHGSYLLFNDTLQHRFLGKDVNGIDRYFTETLDISYSVGQIGTATGTNAYSLINEYKQQKVAVSYLNECILPHFGKELKPFSWLLVKAITVTDNTNNVTRPYVQTGQRGIVVACGNIITSNTELMKKRLASRQIASIVSGLAYNHKDKFEMFFAPTNNLYSTMIPTGQLPVTNEYLRNLGFIAVSSSSSISYPSQREDINAYVSELVNKTYAQIEKTYGGYPLVMQKFAIAKSVLTDIGYIF